MSASKGNIFKRLFKSKTAVRHSVGPAASTAVGLSGESAGVSGSDNSAATSRNLRDASMELDQYLQAMEQAEPEGRSFDVVSMSRWIEKQEAYSNASFSGIDLEPVHLSILESSLVDLAAVCAEEAYNRPNRVVAPSEAFEVVGEITRLAIGPAGSSIKATTIGAYKPTVAASGIFNVIVVAIRGTVSIHDWMVNLNDGPEIPVEDPFMASLLTKAGSQPAGKDSSGNPHCAHAGFLESAKEMLPGLAAALSKAVDDLSQIASSPEKPSLVLTGHSAGGAVAAVFYAHLAASDPDTDSLTDLKTSFSDIHCITFGAPPITTKPLQPLNGTSILLSIINEGDPVPRADKKYITSLLKLFVTPMPQGYPRWPLSPSLFFNAGKVLLVPKGGGKYLAPRELGDGSLAETIMGNPKMHKMRLYLEYQRSIT